MMQMIRACQTVLFRASKTELTPSTNATREPDPNQSTKLQSSTMFNIRTERDNTANALVSTHMR